MCYTTQGKGKHMDLNQIFIKYYPEWTAFEAVVFFSVLIGHFIDTSATQAYSLGAGGFCVIACDISDACIWFDCVYAAARDKAGGV